MTDRNAEDELLEAALGITDRTPIAWDRLDAESGSDQRTLERLRLLEEVTGAFGATDREEPDPLPRADRSQALFEWGTLRILRPIGEGSFGEVFAAWEPALEREVALKLRRPETGVLRWLDEARSLARVRHPNVLTVFGADLHQGRAGMWTELLGGRSLESELASRGPFAPAEAAHVVRDLCGALQAVHRAGLVHGDLKAANVMLEPGDGGARVVLMDFGSAHESPPHHTPTGAAFGTPLVLAPEVLAGQPASIAGDIYSAGVLLHRLLTGRYPLEASSLHELRERHARGESTAIGATHPGVPRPLVMVAERALSGHPRSRYPSALSMRDALAEAIGETTPRQRAERAAWTIAAVAVVAAVALFLWARSRPSLESAPNIVPLPPVTLSLPTRPSWTIEGGRAREWLGGQVVPLGDIDRDGFADVAIAVQEYSRNLLHAGKVMIFTGSKRSLGSIPWWAGEGATASAYFGLYCAAGDVNGDGLPDFAASESGFFRGSDLLGRVAVFLGSAKGLPASASQSIEGDTNDSRFGNAVAIADVNGDGYDDLIVGADSWHLHLRDQGAAFLYLGGPRGLRREPSWRVEGGRVGMHFGYPVTNVGDVNGDHYTDVMVGAPYWSSRRETGGAAFLFLGGPAGLSARPAWKAAGRKSSDFYGGVITGLGDVNGDGLADVAIGAPHADGRYEEEGRVEIYYGTRAGLMRQPAWVATGFGTAARLGHSLSGGCDADGDGIPDLLVGSSGYTVSDSARGAGAVLLYRGTGHGVERTPSWHAVETARGSGFGYRVALVGDVDGSGVSSLVATAPWWSGTLAEQGRAYLFHGAPRRTRPQR
jgi:serine/threonine protein kinase